MRCDGQRLVPALMTLSVLFLAAATASAASPDMDGRGKALKVIPSQDSDVQRHPPVANWPSVGRRFSADAAADSTPPGPPGNLVATSAQLSDLTAHWDPAVDPESGIGYYAFAVGTNPSSAAGPLDNVRGWQATLDTHISVPLSLDPSITYYVSVAAINSAQMWGPIVTSNAVHPAWTPIGQTGNVLTLAFTGSGYDASGNPAAGWSSAQIATMQGFFNRMYPILVELYGPPAVSYTVTVVRDLRYAGSNIFIPSTDEIRMSDSFFPQLFSHELIHAFRNDYLLSSDQNWAFDPTLSGFEEGFAQAVSYEAMNVYAERHPTDPPGARGLLVGLQLRVGLRLPEHGRASRHGLLEHVGRHQPALAQIRDGGGGDAEDQPRVARGSTGGSTRNTTGGSTATRRRASRAP